jgi:hypothetical protein
MHDQYNLLPSFCLLVVQWEDQWGLSYLQAGWGVQEDIQDVINFRC